MYEIIIPLGVDSLLDNLELRFCLRSIEKWMPQVDRIILAGTRPSWCASEIKNVQGCTDYTLEKSYRIYLDTRLATSYLSSTAFTFLNDDVFLLQEYNPNLFPHRGPLDPEKFLDSPGYQQLIENTRKLFPKGNDWGNHAPLRINVNHLRNMNLKFPAGGLEVKSCYANSFKLRGKYVEDCKINTPMLKEEILQTIQGRSCFSIGDRAFTEGSEMFETLLELFPKESRWEAQPLTMEPYRINHANLKF